jgi:hypothetical protein
MILMYLQYVPSKKEEADIVKRPTYQMYILLILQRM